MPEEISSVPWTLPITLEVIVDLQEVLNRVGTPDVLLRVPLTLGDQRLLLSISSHIIASIDVSGKSPLSVHESGRVALEMLIASDVYRRLSVLLDVVLELTRNDPDGYTQQRLPQGLVEILRLNYPWTLSDTSRHFAFEVSEIGLRTSISVKALLIGIGLTVGSISPVIKCIDDAVKVANDLRFFADRAAKKWSLRGSLKLG